MNRRINTGERNVYTLGNHLKWLAPIKERNRFLRAKRLNYKWWSQLIETPFSTPFPCSVTWLQTSQHNYSWLFCSPLLDTSVHKSHILCGLWIKLALQKTLNLRQVFSWIPATDKTLLTKELEKGLEESGLHSWRVVQHVVEMARNASVTPVLYTYLNIS